MIEFAIEQLKSIEKETLNDVREETIDLLQEESFDYDSYIEVLITAFGSSPALEMSLKDHLQEIFYETNFDHHKADELLEAVKKIDKRLLPLLLDPLIAVRYEKFLQFIVDFDIDESVNILEIRKQFIADKFQNKTFFRAVRINPGETHQDTQLSNKARICKNNSDKIQFSEPPEREGNEEKYALYMTFHPNRLMFLDNFSGGAIIHVKGGETASSELISISEHPEIAWMAVATHGEEKYKKFKKDTRIVVSRFEMSEFYAPARNEIPKMGDFSGEYDFDSTNVEANSTEVERLVPLSLPKDWNKDSREYVVKSTLGFK